MPGHTTHRCNTGTRSHCARIAMPHRLAAVLCCAFKRLRCCDRMTLVLLRVWVQGTLAGGDAPHPLLEPARALPSPGFPLGGRHPLEGAALLAPLVQDALLLRMPPGRLGRLRCCTQIAARLQTGTPSLRWHFSVHRFTTSSILSR